MNKPKDLYEMLEQQPSRAPENVTVAFMEASERLAGEPWPISGDLTTIHRMHSEHVHVAPHPEDLNWCTL